MKRKIAKRNGLALSHSALSSRPKRSSKGLALSSSKGFTLIEVLVVIGIIAILAGIVLIAINPARQFAQARNSQRTSNVNAILNAIGQYIADNKGSLPSGVPAKGAAAIGIPQNLCEALVPIYVPSLPTDPQSTPFKGASLVKAGGAGYGCEDLASADLDYDISQDNDGRITITAPTTELTNPTPCTTTSDPACISITR